MKILTLQKLQHYLALSEAALAKAKKARENIVLKNARKDFLDTIERYLKDARHFYEKGDFVNAFAAINYAHGWLDAGARLGLWEVHDSRLFAVEDE